MFQNGFFIDITAAPGLAQATGMPGVSETEIGVQLQSFLRHLDRLGVVLARFLVVVVLGAQNVIIGGHVFGRLALAFLQVRRFHAARQIGDDGLGDFVLHREHVL
ncbi:MAG: hypothetical protein VCD31_07305, partial [Alphaproteobacteria bacterium]